jgi:hypothetical protein
MYPCIIVQDITATCMQGALQPAYGTDIVKVTL